MTSGGWVKTSDFILFTHCALVTLHGSLSGNGVPSVRCQATTRSNMLTYYQQNTFENVICEVLMSQNTRIPNYAWCNKGWIRLGLYSLKIRHHTRVDGWMGGIDFWNDASLTHWPLGDFNEILKIMFKLILVTDGCDISSEIAIRWASLDLSDDKSTLVQVMAWCRQATNHYLNQCWARSLPPYGVTRPQWGVFPLAGLLCQLNKWAHQLMILWVLESPLQTCI